MYFIFAQKTDQRSLYFDLGQKNGMLYSKDTHIQVFYILKAGIELISYTDHNGTHQMIFAYYFAHRGYNT